MNTFKCNVCDLQCTGPEPYQQHIAGIKHKKKENLRAAILGFSQTSGNTLNNGTPISNCIIDRYMLKPETKKLNSLDSATDITINKGNSDSLVLNSSDEVDGSIKPVEPFPNVAQMNIESNFVQSNYTCKICNVPCSGLFPYQQHISGKNHLKREKLIQLSSSGATLGVTQNIASVMGASASPATTYLTEAEFMRDRQSNCDSSESLLNEQESSLVTSAMQELTLRPEPVISEQCIAGASSSAPSSTIADQKQVGPILQSPTIQNVHPGMNFNCNLCQIICSGHDQYKQHMQGKLHMKKLKFQNFQLPVPASSEENILPKVYGYVFPQASRSSQNQEPKSGNDEETVNSSPLSLMSTVNGDSGQNQLVVQSSMIQQVATADGTIKGSSLNDYKNINPITYKCDICDVICSGLEPYTAHMQGKQHKKKAANRYQPDGSVGCVNNIPGHPPQVSNSVDFTEHGITIVEPDSEVSLDEF